VIAFNADLLFGGYTLYGRVREALNPDFRPSLYAEIMRPVTFAAKTVAYAVRATHDTHTAHTTHTIRHDTPPTTHACAN
jgi:hypothetical protein